MEKVLILLCDDIKSGTYILLKEFPNCRSNNENYLPRSVLRCNMKLYLSNLNYFINLQFDKLRNR